MYIGKTNRGDTIIEVLIAITIAGLAIATSYSIAQKAIQKAVAARERDKAIGLLEGQVNALKLRWQEKTDEASFATNFAAVANFCLVANANDPNDSTNWPAQTNGIADTSLTQQPKGNYNSACIQDPLDKIYYLNIKPVPDTGSSKPDFRLDVRWSRLGGGPDNDATFYYRF